MDKETSKIVDALVLHQPLKLKGVSRMSNDLTKRARQLAANNLFHLIAFIISAFSVG